MENTLSELGEWKDVECYPMYKISSTGAVVNKRTLKILKHYKHYESGQPCVTLYRAKVGEVLSVALFLKIHFPEAILNVMDYAASKEPSKKKPNY